MAMRLRTSCLTSYTVVWRGLRGRADAIRRVSAIRPRGDAEKRRRDLEESDH
jgi:hypothetical protein